MRQALSFTIKKSERFSLIAAPLLFACSTFYWHNGEYSVVSSTLIVASLFFWLFAFSGLFNMVSNFFPRYSVWGLWMAYAGCISGVCFAFLGYISSVLHIPHQEYLKALSDHPFTAQLLLFASGPLFPLSILLLEIQMMRKQILPFYMAILFCLVGFFFPLGRIFRIDWIAHATDALLLFPCLLMALKNKNFTQRRKEYQ
jgi:hypothetical protein